MLRCYEAGAGEEGEVVAVADDVEVVAGPAASDVSVIGPGGCDGGGRVHLIPRPRAGDPQGAVLRQRD
jgi:hypothetical protein